MITSRQNKRWVPDYCFLSQLSAQQRTSCENSTNVAYGRLTAIQNKIKAGSATFNFLTHLPATQNHQTISPINTSPTIFTQIISHPRP